MFYEAAEMTYDDFTQRYLGTWVRTYDDYMQLRPTKIQDLSGKSDGTSILTKQLYSDGKTSSASFLYNKFVFSDEHPSLGFINYHDCAHYVQRVPRRQWKRGLTSRNLSSHNVSRYEATICSIPMNINLETNRAVLELFERKYPSLQESMLNILNGIRLSEAFHNKYAIGSLANTSVPVLWYKTWKVGWVDENLVVNIPEAAKHLLEELSQYVEVKVI